MNKFMASGLAAMSLVAMAACGGSDDKKDPDCFVEPAQTCAGKCGSIVDECGITQDCGACESDAGTTDAGTTDAGTTDAGTTPNCNDSDDICTDAQYCGDDGACHAKVEAGDPCDATMQEYCDGDTVVYCYEGEVDKFDCTNGTVCRSIVGQNWTNCYDLEEAGCDALGTSEVSCGVDEDENPISINRSCSATHSGDSVIWSMSIECDEECVDATGLCDNAETCDTLDETASKCETFLFWGVSFEVSFTSVCTQWGNSLIWTASGETLCPDACGTDAEGLCDDPCKDVTCNEGFYCDSEVGDSCIPNGITLYDDCDPDTFEGVCKAGIAYYCDESYEDVESEECEGDCNAAGTACVDPCDTVTCDAGYHCVSGGTEGYCFSDNYTAGAACDNTTFGSADGVCSAKAEYNTGYYCKYESNTATTGEIAMFACTADAPCLAVNDVADCYAPCTEAEANTTKTVCDSRYDFPATVQLTCTKTADGYVWYEDYSTVEQCVRGCDEAGVACDDACDPATDSVVHSCEIYFMWYVSTKIVCNPEGKWEDGGYDWCTDDGCNPDGSCIEIDND